MRDQQVDQPTSRSEGPKGLDHARECCDGKNQYAGHKLFRVVPRDEPACEDQSCDPADNPEHWLDITPTNLAKSAPALLAACEEAKALIDQLHTTWADKKKLNETMNAVDVFWMHWLQPAIEEAKRKDRGL